MTYDPTHPAQWAVITAAPDHFALDPRGPANGSTDAIELAGLDYLETALAAARAASCAGIINRATREIVTVRRNRFASHDDAEDHAAATGWRIEQTEPMESGVVATFSLGGITEPGQ